MKMNNLGLWIGLSKVDFVLVLPPLKCGLGFATLIFFVVNNHLLGNMLLQQKSAHNLAEQQVNNNNKAKTKQQINKNYSLHHNPKF